VPNRVLFNGQHIYDFVEAQKEKLKADYKALPDDQALDEASVKEFKSKYMISIPTLKTDAWERGEDQGQMRVFVPFEGDPFVFTLSPSFFDGTMATGDIVDHDVVFTMISLFGNFDVVAEVRREISNVERRLHHLRGSMLHMDQQLELGLRESMMVRRRAVEARKSQPEINIPLRAPKPQPVPPSPPLAVKKAVTSEKPLPQSWDIFMSHADLDRLYARDLVKALRADEVTVWFDEDSVAWGESLARGMKKGILHSRYAIVVLSKAYLAERKWTEHEFEGFLAREKLNERIILPIWHCVTHEDIVRYDAPLSLRKAKISETDGIADIAASVLALLGRTSKTPKQ